MKTSIQKLMWCTVRPKLWRHVLRGVAPSIEHKQVVRNVGIDSVFDVGANRGQFSLLCKLERPSLSIWAYEPLSSEALVYRSVLSNYSHVQLYEYALGSEFSATRMHISGRADSSSLLPIGSLQRNWYPATAEVGTADVRVVPLDSLPEHWSEATRGLLKIDVQGYELNVLKGARKALKHMAYIYVECSEVELYAGQALRPEVQAFLEENGFRLERRHNEQWHKGQLVQADYLFCRASG
jgi:FkbM family methyltransferase